MQASPIMNNFSVSISPILPTLTSDELSLIEWMKDTFNYILSPLEFFERKDALKYLKHFIESNKVDSKSFRYLLAKALKYNMTINSPIIAEKLFRQAWTRALLKNHNDSIKMNFKIYFPLEDFASNCLSTIGKSPIVTISSFELFNRTYAQGSEKQSESKINSDYDDLYS